MGHTLRSETITKDGHKIGLWTCTAQQGPQNVSLSSIIGPDEDPRELLLEVEMIGGCLEILEDPVSETRKKRAVIMDSLLHECETMRTVVRSAMRARTNIYGTFSQQICGRCEFELLLRTRGKVTSFTVSVSYSHYDPWYVKRRRGKSTAGEGI